MTFAPNDSSGGMAQLPKYKCHKTVHAVEIQGVILPRDGASGGTLIPVEGSGFGMFNVSQAYLDKHRPLPRGYYVKYDDGYESWSPKDIFEAGYDPL